MWVESNLRAFTTSLLHAWVSECVCVCVFHACVSSKEQVAWAVGCLNSAFSFRHQLIPLLSPFICAASCDHNRRYLPPKIRRAACFFPPPLLSLPSPIPAAEDRASSTGISSRPAALALRRSEEKPSFLPSSLPPSLSCSCFSFYGGFV